MNGKKLLYGSHSEVEAACMKSAPGSNVRSSALDEQLQRWEMTTANIHDRIQLLECRLGRVLTPPAPATECVKGESGCGPNELTRQMDVRNEVLAGVHSYLQYVIDRIEL